MHAQKIKYYLQVIFLLFFISSLSASETALSAINALRDAARPELLAGLVEVKGEHGAPQPEEWIVLCNDTTAQGGVRELTVTGHHIVSERTPLNGFGGEGDLPSLNIANAVIDSGAVFAAANREAIAHHLGFDSINYVLRTDALSGEPLWIVHLNNASGALVGTIQFSGKSGAIIKPLNIEKPKS